MTSNSSYAGTKKQLVCVSGWAMNSSLWLDVLEPLRDEFKLILVNFPEKIDTDIMVDHLAHITPPGAALLGWSLGGLASLKFAANHPNCVSKVIAVATTPQFVSDDQWPWGMDKPTFQGFYQQFILHPNKTLKRFTALQAKGDHQPTDTAKKLQQHCQFTTPPKILEKGLTWLKGSSFISDLSYITAETLLIHGKNDAITPYQSSKQMGNRIHHASTCFFENTGHAPFISHNAMFTDKLGQFLQ